MKTRGIALLAMVALLVAGVAFAEKAEKKEVNLKGVKCPVSGNAAKNIDGSSVAHNGGTVYLCCTNCPTAFKKNTKKFAAKANFQLYATGQAKLVKCPLKGKPLNTATKISIEGKDVCFCCNGCKGAAGKATDKIALVFGDAAFKKGFKVGAKKKK